MGDLLYGTPNHPDWTLFIRQDTTQENYAKVATYVNKRLAKMRFTLRLDIINHRDINVLAFHNDQDTNYIINIYSDSNQTALQALWKSMTNIDKTIILTKDFNIRDSDWDPNYRHHSSHTDNLITIADSLGLELSPLLNPGPTRFADNPRDTNSVIDLVFLPLSNIGFGRHTLHPKICRPPDYVPLIIEIGIRKVNTNINIWSIKKDNKEEKEFISSLIQGVQSLDTSPIRSQANLESITNGHLLFVMGALIL